jgi:hypothetical protein
VLDERAAPHVSTPTSFEWLGSTTSGFRTLPESELTTPVGGHGLGRPIAPIEMLAEQPSRLDFGIVFSNWADVLAEISRVFPEVVPILDFIRRVFQRWVA